MSSSQQKSSDTDSTKEKIKVALVQMTSTDDVEANQKQILSLLSEIEKSESIDLVVFPENSLFLRVDSGSNVQSFDLSEAFFLELQEFCLRSKAKILLGSLPVKEAQSVSNAMVLVCSEEPPRVVYRKIHLFDVEVEGQKPVRESDQFRHGSQTAIINLYGWKLGLSICYDLRFSELYLKYAKAEVDAILVPSAFLVPTGQAHWHILLRARAIECQSYVLAPAQGGIHKGKKSGERETFGHSLAVDPWGRIICEISVSPSFEVVELSLKELQRVRKQIPMKDHRRL